MNNEPDKLRFTKCPISGHLKGEGKKGQYWITDNAWKYLTLVEPTEMGPQIRNLGTYNEIYDAILDANEIDVAEDEV